MAWVPPIIYICWGDWVGDLSGGPGGLAQGSRVSSLGTDEEFKVLTTKLFDPEQGIPFPKWLSKRFMAISHLLGALRSEQFSRFRKGGLRSIEWLMDNKDTDHRIAVMDS